MRLVHSLRFALDFAKGDEIKTIRIGMEYEPEQWDEPKEAAIFHVADKVHGKVADLDGFVPLFRTFRVIEDRPLADLAWR